LERAFYRLCTFAGLRLTERAGSRTLRGISSASGLKHESDAVIAAADITIHVEMKSLFGDVPKNALISFNQKGLDFIVAPAPEIRSRPFYRLFLSTTPLTPDARRFAAIWGIGIIEPDRLPLAVMHWLAGSDLEVGVPRLVSRDRAWTEIPKLLMPLQAQLHRLAAVVEGAEQWVTDEQIDTILDRLQRSDGAPCWAALDRRDPLWLERVYQDLVRGCTPSAAATPKVPPNDQAHRHALVSKIPDSIDLDQSGRANRIATVRSQNASVAGTRDSGCT
jgi:hypothetical protein